MLIGDKKVGFNTLPMMQQTNATPAKTSWLCVITIKPFYHHI
jgi:hypothetical protein